MSDTRIVPWIRRSGQRVWHIAGGDLGHSEVGTHARTLCGRTMYQVICERHGSESQPSGGEMCRQCLTEEARQR